MPLMAKAGLKTIVMDGKTVSVADAPLDALILALAAVNPIDEAQQKASEMVQANADIAARLEKAESDLTVANATAGGLRNQVGALTERANTAEGTVSRLTAERQSMDLEMRSLKSENTRITSEFLEINNGLSNFCMDVQCLTDLRDKDGKIIPTTSSATEKLAAANLIKPPERFAAARGALNLAASRIGVVISQLPATNGTEPQNQKPELKGRERFISAQKVANAKQ